jgi:hypothetical protein
MAGTRRTPLRRSVAPRVSPYAVHLYRLGLKMQHDGVDESSREWLDLTLALHRELGLKPWHPFIFDLDPDDDTPGRFPVDLDDMISRQREHVLELLRQLRAAVAADDASQPREAILAPPPH